MKVAEEEAEVITKCPDDLALEATRMFLERHPDWVPLFDSNGTSIGVRPGQTGAVYRSVYDEDDD